MSGKGRGKGGDPFPRTPAMPRGFAPPRGALARPGQMSSGARGLPLSSGTVPEEAAGAAAGRAVSGVHAGRTQAVASAGPRTAPAPPPPGVFQLSSGQWVSVGGPSASAVQAAPPSAGYALQAQGSSSAAAAPAAPAAPRRARADQPVHNPTFKGNKALALASAVSEATKRQALEDLHGDKEAQTSRGSRVSCLKTWAEFHEAWFGSEVEVYPLTKESISCVAAMFKAGRYRSYKNYFYFAKGQHEELEFVWTRHLQRAGKQVIRSVYRGIGAAKQSGHLDLLEVHQLGLPTDPVSDGGQVNPALVLVVQAFFGMREIEGSLSLRQSFTPDAARRVLGCHLPWSKTDPQALGTHRYWGCVCAGLFQAPCAYCAWERHDRNLRERFGDRVDEPGFPAFPDADGGFVVKARVAETAEALAERLGLPTVSADGRNIFTAHYIRISGAVFLVKMGVEIWLLKLLFRWRSAVVMRYVGEAPLQRLGATQGRTLEEVARGTAAGAVLDRVEALQKSLGALQEGQRSARLRVEEVHALAAQPGSEPSQQLAQQALQELGELRAQLQGFNSKLAETAAVAHGNARGAAESSLQGAKICSATKVAHRPIIMGLTTSRDKVKTACGWEFGLSRYADCPTLPTKSKNICERCFPLEKAEALSKERSLAAHSDDSDTSSSSSNDEVEEEE